MRHLLKEDIKTSLELIDARAIIETANAELAAERADEDDLARLENCIEKMRIKLREDDTVNTEDANFHLSIAEATHNKIQTHLMFSIYDLLKETVGLCYYDDEAENIFRQHCRIVEAIKDKDPQQARERMEEHLSYIKSLVNRLLDNNKGEKRE